MVEGCLNVFHSLCISGADNLTPAAKLNWACPECRASIRKVGDNTQTPVGAAKVKASFINDRKRESHKTEGEDYVFKTTEFLEVMAEIRDIRRNISDIAANLALLTSTMAQHQVVLENCSTVTGVVSAKLDNLEVRARAEEQLRKCVVHPKTKKSYAAIATAHENTSSQDKTKSIAKKQPVEDGKTQEPTTAHVTPPTSQLEKHTSSDDSGDDEGWTEVRKKARRPVSLHCTAGPSVTKLKAVERRKHFHLWNMVSGAEEIRTYLQELCSPGSGTVEELKPKGQYKSYKIGVPVDLYEKCYSIDMWPDNARVKPWIPFRGARPKTGTQG